MYDSFIAEIYFITCPTLNHISCTKAELHFMGWTLTEKKLLQLQFQKTPEWELEMCSPNHKCLAGFFFYIYMLVHFLWYCIRLQDVIIHTLQHREGNKQYIALQPLTFIFTFDILYHASISWRWFLYHFRQKILCLCIKSRKKFTIEKRI